MYKLVVRSVERGLTTGQALTLAGQHQPSRDKFEKRLPREVGRRYAKHPHLGLSCVGAGCPNRRTDRTPEGDAGKAIAALRLAMDSYDWAPGQKGRSQRAVLSAHLDAAAEVGSVTYGLSMIEAAERAVRSRRTVIPRTRELVAMGWLVIVVPGRWQGTNATTWRLAVPASVALAPRFTSANAEFAPHARVIEEEKGGCGGGDGGWNPTLTYKKTAREPFAAALGCVPPGRAQRQWSGRLPRAVGDAGADGG